MVKKKIEYLSAVLCSPVQDIKVSILMKFETHKKRYKSFSFEEVRNTQIWFLSLLISKIF